MCCRSFEGWEYDSGSSIERVWQEVIGLGYGVAEVQGCVGEGICKNFLDLKCRDMETWRIGAFIENYSSGYVVVSLASLKDKAISVQSEL